MIPWGKFILVATVCTVTTQVARSRVFDMNSERFAAYFNGTYAASTVGKAPFEKASPFNETYDNQIDKTYSGEFGFIYASRYLNVRFGIEVLRNPTTGVIAYDAAGVRLYS